MGAGVALFGVGLFVDDGLAYGMEVWGYTVVQLNNNAKRQA